MKLLSLALLLCLALTVAGVPSAAAAAKPKRITCVNKGGSDYLLKRKPGRCTVFGSGGTFGGGVDLRGLKWTDWGKKAARATGIECGFRQDCVNIPVKVKAFRLRTCGGKRVYTRLRASSTFGTTTAPAPRCPGPA